MTASPTHPNRSAGHVGLSLLLLGAGAFLGGFFSLQEPVTLSLGHGKHQYEWVADWGALPDGTDLGNTHGCIVVDSAGQVYINTDTEHAVVVFSPEGERVNAWGKDLAGGLHGMAIRKEGEQEFLYLTHTARHQVLKTTLEGEVVWTLDYPKESGVYEDARQYRPTSIAVAPDGRIYVADGYGRSWIHMYDSQGKYLKSWGGPGSEPGKLRTPHGIWLDTRGDEAVLIVADRENHRLQTFDLDGKHLAVIEGHFRRPCHVHIHERELVVADLAGRVTILDENNQLVAHLGDNPDPKKRAKNGIPKADWAIGEFISPHCARWDAHGNLYVLEWLSSGRIVKLKRAEKGS